MKQRIDINNDSPRAFSVYLGGTLSGRSIEEVSKERMHITKLLNEAGIQVYDPMREKYETLRDSKDLRADKSGYDRTEIVGRDLDDIDHTDMLIVLTGDNATWGTALEFGYAIWGGNRPRKPVLLIAPEAYRKMQDGWWSWHTVWATKVVPDAESAVEWLKTFWLASLATPKTSFVIDIKNNGDYLGEEEKPLKQLSLFEGEEND